VGQPRRGDEGLDRTHTWARTYWGGALFWFAADVALREETRGAIGLPQVLRRLVDEGRDIRTENTAAEWLRAADGAAGVPVISRLYEELASQPGRPDLGSYWRRLGVARTAEGIAFDDTAPLAALRRGITDAGGAF
jgi:predicted metalloprotease with PDZ domain